MNSQHPIDVYIEKCKDVLSSLNSNFTLDARKAGRDFLTVWESSRAEMRAIDRLHAWPYYAKILLFPVWISLWIYRIRKADTLLKLTEVKQKQFKELSH